jgi:hypothetical protein
MPQDNQEFVVRRVWERGPGVAAPRPFFQAAFPSKDLPNIFTIPMEGARGL